MVVLRAAIARRPVVGSVAAPSLSWMKMHRRGQHTGNGANVLADSMAWETTRQRALAGRVAANIRALRDGRALTQAQLAKLSGLPRAT